MKKIICVTALITLITANIPGAFAQSWHTVGSADFSAGTVGYPSMAIDGSGTPYVVYQDAGNSYKATVMKYNGSSWVNVGSAGFSAADFVYYTSIAIDVSGTPYVVYQDPGNSSKATVMKYDGSSWVNVGSAGFSAGVVYYTSIAIDGSGTPYVAYEDAGNSNKTTVMKYNGSSWVAVGSPGFSADMAEFTTIAIDGSGTPYVAYLDHSSSYKATVMKYNGSSWVAVGAPGFSAGEAQYTSLAINASGTPYVAYKDYGNSQKASVMKYDGSSWVTVGSAGFSAGAADGTSIAIDGSGIPYVVYEDWGNSEKATVMKYIGSSWSTAGSAGFSSGAAGGYNYSIAINGSGVPYVVYVDGGGGGYATVMEYGTEISPITGTTTVCVGTTVTLSDATTGGTWSSSNTSIATISGSGVVTGVAGGSATISYTVSGSWVTAAVSVSPLPSAGSITGSSTVCPGSTSSLSDVVTGGVWHSSSTSVATVSSSGIVTGVGLGSAVISYSVSNSCGTTIATFPFTVSPTPSAGSITGISTACPGTTAALSDGVSGGTWSSGAPAVATISTSGIVTGVAVGSTVISFIVTNSCGTAIATYPFTVSATPTAGAITGAASTVCVGSVITFADPVSGGAWSSSNTSVAMISSAGAVTGVSGGSAVISYTVTSGCGTAHATVIVTVNPLPPAGSISGSSGVCLGTAITLSETVTGGVWSSSSPAIATVSPTGMVTGVTAGTAAIIYTVTSGCSNFATHTITSGGGALPASSITPSGASLCSAPYANLSVSTTATSLEFQWYKNGVLIAGATSVGYTATTTGAYSVVISNGCGTDTLAAVSVTAIPNPLVNLTGSNILYTGSFSTYQWYLNGVAIPGANSGIYIYTLPGVYTVKVTDSHGCSGTSAAYTVSGTISGIREVAGVDIQIYPNPLSSIMHIKAPVGVNVTILNMVGQVVIEQQNATDLKMSGMANGMYIIKVYDENNEILKIEKLVKEE